MPHSSVALSDSFPHGSVNLHLCLLEEDKGGRVTIMRNGGVGGVGSVLRTSTKANIEERNECTNNEETDFFHRQAFINQGG